MVHSMWLFKHKFHADGTLSRYKARLVANGSSQRLGVKNVERKDDFQSAIREGNNGRKKDSNSSSPTGSGSIKRAWNIQVEILEAIKRSANKYAVLEDQECENQKEAKEGIETGEIDTGEINDVYWYSLFYTYILP
ncbi:hypothetical protein Tco_0094859 [Tanacetum coccineum]